MATIAWTEALPSDGSNVGLGPPELRAHQVSVAQWLGDWLDFPGSGGGSNLSTGLLKAGASRAFVGAVSGSSNADPGTLNGRLYFDSGQSLLYVYDSNGTFCLGGPTLVERFNPTRTQQYVSASGQSFVGAPNTPERSFSFSSDGRSANGITFAATPIVMVTCSHGSIVFGVSAVTTGGFTSTASWWGSGATSSYTMTWRASGYTAQQVI